MPASEMTSTSASRAHSTTSAAGALVVLVQRDEAWPVLDVQAGEESLRRSGVLGDHDRHAAERIDETRGGVAQIADRRRREEEHGLSLPWARRA